MARTLALLAIPFAATATGIVIVLWISVQVCWFDQTIVPRLDMLRDGLVVFLIFVAVLGCGFGRGVRTGGHVSRQGASNRHEMRAKPKRSIATRDSILALVQGLRINHEAIIEAAGKMRHRDIARSYYQMAAAQARCIKDLCIKDVTTFTSAIKSDEDSRFVKQLQALAADMEECLNDDDPYAVLSATVRMEDAVIDQYRRGILHASETSASSLLRHQCVETLAARDALVALRDRYAPRVVNTTEMSLHEAHTQHYR